MDEINKFAKDNDLARKFEKAIMNIDRGQGWAPFAGLDKGEVTVKVIYDGQIRFAALEKPKPKKKKEKKKVKDDPTVRTHKVTTAPIPEHLKPKDTEPEKASSDEE